MGLITNKVLYQISKLPSVHQSPDTTSIAMATLHYLPPVKPSAIALGTVFNHAVSLAVMAPLFGETYHRAQAANTKEEFFKSKEAATGAAYLGSLIFFASAAPSVVSQVLTEKRPLDTVAVGAVARVFETVGLSLFLTYWGTRTNPFD